MDNTTIYIFQVDANGIRNGTRNTSSGDSTLKVFGNTGIPSTTPSDNSDIYIYRQYVYISKGTQIANENGSFTLSADSYVIYGYEDKIIVKYFTKGTYAATNRTFGDPAVGYTKHAWLCVVGRKGAQYIGIYIDGNIDNFQTDCSKYTWEKL